MRCSGNGIQLTTIGSATTGEKKDLVACCPAGVKVEARIGQGADNEYGVGCVVVLALGDDVPSLAVGSATVGYLDGREVGPEVAG